MFRVGDKVAHPMHGAGVIDGIVTETVAGGSQDYYVFRMPVGGLVLKIPTAASAAVGLRSVVDPVKAAKLLRDLTMLEVERFTGSWNQRYRENMQKIKSGDLYEVARGGQGPGPPGQGAGPLHRGAEDAAQRQADSDLRDGAVHGGGVPRH